ncbi:MAG: hypothetical protein ACYT04_61800, partial [Nostoc sp.]
VRKPARKSGDDLPVARTNVLVWYARSGLKLSGFRERVAYMIFARVDILVRKQKRSLGVSDLLGPESANHV